MLRELEITRLAVVEHATISFGPGFSVLTGETGAGKSILLDGLLLALGGRASSDLVRHGADRADVNVLFTLEDSPEALLWLQEQSLDDGNECILRRTLSSDGRSRCFVNGQATPAGSVRQLGRLLLDIHGQHEHQHLLQPAEQLDVLDTFSEAESLSTETAELQRQWITLQQQLTELDNSQADQNARQELLNYQIGELNLFALQPDEWAELEAEQRQLSHAHEILQQGNAILGQLSANERSALESLEKADSALVELVELAPSLSASHDLLASAVIEVGEAVHDLRHQLDHVQLNPERLSHVNQRMTEALELARKHNIEPEALPEQLLALENELAALVSGNENRDELQQQLETLRQRYAKTAKKLSTKRKKGGEQLSTSVTQQLQTLGMAAASFQVEIQPVEQQQPAARGLETANFLICTNPGAPARMLGRVASGGELSRLSLAIQAATMARKSVPTLLFDEVDAGIGGAVADTVGQQLRQLGQTRQVICITHLPQVAAQGQQHLRVSKETRETSAQTTIETLDEAARVEELARMLGGNTLTDKTRAHAHELLTSGS